MQHGPTFADEHMGRVEIHGGKFPIDLWEPGGPIPMSPLPNTDDHLIASNDEMMAIVRTGLLRGAVEVRVTWGTGAPPIRDTAGDESMEIEEVSLYSPSSMWRIGNGELRPIPPDAVAADGWYRIRCTATGRSWHDPLASESYADPSAGTAVTSVERYELEIWPAPGDVRHSIRLRDLEAETALDPESMPSAVFFDGTLYAHYHMAFLHWSPADDDETDIEFDPALMFARQANGLLGVATPGEGMLSFGRHTGRVGFRAEYLVAHPPLDDAYEDVVEASIDLARPRLFVTEWGNSGGFEVTLPIGPLRLRYSCSGRDAERAGDYDAFFARDDEPPTLERYLLQFWRAPMAADAVLRQTSDDAMRRNRSH